MILNFLDDLELNKKDFIYLIAIFVLSFSIVAFKFESFKTVGLYSSDVLVYMFNALYYSGMNSNYLGGTDYLFSTPFISFLTSILFRLGWVNVFSIFTVTAVMDILGNLGLYVLLKRRFDNVLAFTGTVIYFCSALYIFYSSIGMIDTPAVAISIWILIFTILSVDINHKYYLVTIPLFIIGMFTRPTVGFMLPIMFLYFCSKHDVLKMADYLFSDFETFKDICFSFLKGDEFKYIMMGGIIAFGIALFVIYCNVYWFGAHFGFFDTVSGSVNNGGYQGNKVWDPAYTEDTLFYIKDIPEFFILQEFGLMGCRFSFILFFIVFIGFILKFIEILKNLDYFKENYDKYYLKNRGLSLFSNICVILLCIAAVFGFRFNHFISNISLIVVFMIILSFSKRYPFDKTHFNLAIIMASWILIYSIFISFINIKVDRYFMPALVPIIYFIICSFDYLTKIISNGFENYNAPSLKSRNEKFNIIFLILIILLLFNAFSTLNYNVENDKYHNGYFNYENMTDFLIKYDPDYKSKKITTDRQHRYYEWFLKNNTNSIDNTINPTTLFDSSDSDYIFIDEPCDFENYTELYNNNHGFYLYERNR